MSNHDGTPLRSSNSEVTVKHGYSRADEVYETTKHRLDQSGVVKLEYTTPSNVTNTTALRIEVSKIYFFAKFREIVNLRKNVGFNS